MSDKTHFTVGFDDATTELLLELSHETGCEPRVLIESMVRDVLLDDACAHGRSVAPEDKRLLN